MNEEKQRYAHEHQPIEKLIDAVQTIKPSYLIGMYSLIELMVFFI